jgi:hypothetical protein
MNEMYGVPQGVVDQARSGQLMQMGLGMIAAGQQLTPAQRAQVMQQIGSGAGDFQSSIYNAAQSRLMSDRIKEARAAKEQQANALTQLTDLINQMPDGREKAMAQRAMQIGEFDAAKKIVLGTGGAGGRWMTPEEKQQVGFGPQDPIWIDENGEPKLVGGRGTTVNNNMGGGGAWDEVNKQYAKEEYGPWILQGGSDALRQVEQISGVLKQLEAGQPLTGPMQGALQAIPGGGDLISAILTPNSVAARDRVGEVVQRNLKAILGAQFTAQEGAALVARAYNPALGPAENASRLRTLLQQMVRAAQAKNDMATYFEQNDGSLRGYRGRKYNFDDFMQLFPEDDDMATYGPGAQ